MKWVAVESSLLKAVAYERDDEVLWLRFRNGRTYTYREVPQEVYEQLLSAESKVSARTTGKCRGGPESTKKKMILLPRVVDSCVRPCRPASTRRQVRLIVRNRIVRRNEHSAHPVCSIHPERRSTSSQGNASCLPVVTVLRSNQHACMNQCQSRSSFKRLDIQEKAHGAHHDGR